ncbi:hypothetical protein RHMOL_Rhmol02G0272100 [Rhododendron molle]|uniref:Uncharacterized protein n=1 Tax=Rhododendron molle TaxID=49168 RepID=A0ACC0PW23_RHOML|nr:hypothetical protein RHMOL_Rhmol02G0272100 [Rhododendron molle]
MINEAGDAGRRLKDGCLSRSVAALEALINEDKLILDRVSSLTGFFINDSTPLHVAALRGHLDFVKALLTRKPEMVTELDSSRSSPLHLACTKGHFEIIEELLRVNTNVCLSRDEDGMYITFKHMYSNSIKVIHSRVFGDAGRRLKDACLSGSVAALEALINEDEFILDQVSSLTGFFINDSTPLHVASLRGHLDFAKALLTRKPELATELDPSWSLPLHLACTKGHCEIVEVLLWVNTNVCLGRDEDGTHYYISFL